MFRIAEELIGNTVKQIGDFIYRKLVVDANLNPLKLNGSEQVLPENGYMVCSRKDLVTDKIAIMVIPIQQGKFRGEINSPTKEILRKLEYFHSWLFYRSEAIPIN